MSDTEIVGLEVIRGEVLPEWIDVNNHMNVACYVLAFDHAENHFLAAFAVLQDDWGWPAELGRQKNIAQPIYTSGRTV